MTVRELIAWGARQFEQCDLVYAHGTDNALDEAASLVLYALDIGYDQPDSILDTVPEEAGLKRAQALLAARMDSRRPAAYLINQAWFAGRPFYVDERVLVPRSPIAELIEARFVPWVNPDRVVAVLDLCTGSGCIGIACAHAFPEAVVDIADLSEDALAVARQNIALHGLESRVNALQSDLFASLPRKRYDIIVSNPPYVPQAELRELAEEFRHEPGIGLEAGGDGLDIVVRILAGAGDYLSAGGILVVEVGNSEEQLVARFPQVPFTWLEFERGGYGVFLLEAGQLEAHRPLFVTAAAERA